MRYYIGGLVSCYRELRLLFMYRRKVEREVKGGRRFRARVGNMSSGTCMLEGGSKSVCGPKLTDQIDDDDDR